jgi:hypothetical protein
MRPFLKGTGLLAPLLVLMLSCSDAFASPCKGEPLIGDSIAETASRCGDAVLKEQRVITVTETDKGGSRSSTTTTDEWTYDRGPDELVLTFRFENGRLSEISSNGYGTAADFSTDACRNGEALSVGDTTVEAYLKCGLPLAREKREARIEESESGGVSRKRAIPVSEWTYRYGRELPGYTVRFEDGIAVDIRTREFGK